MDLNCIFGVNKNITEFADTVKNGFIVDAHSKGAVKTGAPCLVFSRKGDEGLRPSFLGGNSKGRTPHKKVLIPFPSGFGCPPRLILDNHNNYVVVKEIEGPCLLDKIKVIKTQSIDPKKLEDAVGYAQQKGPLNLLVDSPKDLINNLNKIVFKLNKTYSRKSVFHLEYPGPVPVQPGEKILFSLSFIDIAQCLPIFRPERVDGVMLHGAIFYPIRSQLKNKLCCSVEFSFLFSRYDDNIVSVDGTKLGTHYCNKDNLNAVIEKVAKYSKFVGEEKPAEVAKQKSESGGKKHLLKSSIRPSIKEESRIRVSSYTTTTYNTSSTVTTSWS